MALGKFLTVDPGEDTGWSIWKDAELLDAGTTKMWDFSDVVWAVALWDRNVPGQLLSDELEDVVDELRGIKTIVCEDWRLYPWVLKTGAMDFDECRTARLIGSLNAACRLTGWKFVIQPAKIKEAAENAGAESFFSYPLHENRHANDACRHGWYYVVSHADGSNLQIASL